MLSYTAMIPDMHKNLYSIMRALQNGFEVTSEGEALIINRIQPKFA